MRMRDIEIDTSDRTAIMGILNVSDDSPIAFSRVDKERAVERALVLIQEGADIIDVGAHSTATGARDISHEEEGERVSLVIRSLAARGIATSVDTWTHSVAQQAAESGVHLINDVTGGQDSAMRQVSTAHGIPACLMHMRGAPKHHRSVNQQYENIQQEVMLFLSKARDTFVNETGQECWLDPGFGFAKSPEDNLKLLEGITELSSLNQPILISASRKGFLSELMNQGDRQDTEGLLSASLAFNAIAVQNGANIIRVHDVAATRAMLAIVDKARTKN